MDQINGFSFPENLHYIFIDPVSLFWVKEVPEDQNNHGKCYVLGFPELITNNLKKNELKFTFRTEKLNLRANKPFLRLLTRNKMFEFLSPWKCKFEINPEIKNNDFSFLDYPYDQYVIKCFDIEDTQEPEKRLTTIDNLEKAVKKLIEKESYNDCKDCPDFFETSVTRRLKSDS